MHAATIAVMPTVSTTPTTTTKAMEDGEDEKKTIMRKNLQSHRYHHHHHHGYHNRWNNRAIRIRLHNVLLILLLLVLKSQGEGTIRRSSTDLSQEGTASRMRGAAPNDHSHQQQQHRQVIVNGSPVKDAALEFPFLVSLVDHVGNHQCGGTLVAWDVVLTAAHCVDVVRAARILIPPASSAFRQRQRQHDQQDPPPTPPEEPEPTPATTIPPTSAKLPTPTSSSPWKEEEEAKESNAQDHDNHPGNRRVRSMASGTDSGSDVTTKTRSQQHRQASDGRLTIPHNKVHEEQQRQQQQPEQRHRQETKPQALITEQNFEYVPPPRDGGDDERFEIVPIRRGGKVRHPRFFPHELNDITMTPPVLATTNSNEEESVNSAPSDYVDVDPYDLALLALNRPPPPSRWNSNFFGDHNDDNGDNENVEGIPSSVVTLNTNPKIPQKNEGLTVAGWGITNAYQKPKVASETLQQTVLYHIPNSDCKNYSYTSKQGLQVSYQPEIISVSLCAADFVEPTNKDHNHYVNQTTPTTPPPPAITAKQQSDACSGDSGSPLLVRRPKLTTREHHDSTTTTAAPTLEWVQVGVHSSNFGCLNPYLPSLNVRISVVHDWIHSMVCDLTALPPTTSQVDRGFSSLPCPPPSRYPTLVLSTQHYVVVQIKLDHKPTETGYYLQAKIPKEPQQQQQQQQAQETMSTHHESKRGNHNNPPIHEEEDDENYDWVTIAQVYPGTFTKPYQLIQQKLYLLESPTPLEYKFVITDNEHDGGPTTSLWYETPPARLGGSNVEDTANPKNNDDSKTNRQEHKDDKKNKIMLVQDDGSFYLESPYFFSPPTSAEPSPNGSSSAARPMTFFSVVAVPGVSGDGWWGSASSSWLFLPLVGVFWWLM